MSAEKGADGGRTQATVWDNPEYTAARYMNYRRDRLPVEKAVGLTGACTFKEAWAAVHDKRVTVDGQTAALGDLVSAGQTLALDAVELPPREPIVCYLVNKPRQVMSTCQVGETATKGELQKAEEFGTVTDLVPAAPRVVPVGRLDFDSEGLLLLTNDGSLCKLLTCPQFRIPKTYAVLIQSKGPVATSAPPTEEALVRLSQQGVRLQNDVVLKCKDARVLNTVRVPLWQAVAAGAGGGPARADKRKAKKQLLAAGGGPEDRQDNAPLGKRARGGAGLPAGREEASEESASAGGAGGQGGAEGAGGEKHHRESDQTVVLSWVEVVLEEGKNREVRKLMDGIGFRVLRLVRTAIGPLRGPCEQDSEIEAAVPADSGGPDAQDGSRGGHAAGLGLEDGGVARRWWPRLVDRGQVLRVGEATLITADEMDSLFALERGGPLQDGAECGHVDERGSGPSSSG